jgi:hypothetical protein
MKHMPTNYKDKQIFLDDVLFSKDYIKLSHIFNSDFDQLSNSFGKFREKFENNKNHM